MEHVILSSVEELLTIPKNVKSVEISQNDVIRYIYINRSKESEKINVQELRNIFAKSVSKSYRHKNYSENLILNKQDIESVCYECIVK